MKAVQRPQHHTYVLNSTSMVNEVSNKLIAFKETVNQVFLFMDNDEAGYRATHLLAELMHSENLEIGTMEQLYIGWKDLNEKWTSNKSKTFTAWPAL